jgi:hypothetical protein
MFLSILPVALSSWLINYISTFIGFSSVLDPLWSALPPPPGLRAETLSDPSDREARAGERRFRNALPPICSERTCDAKPGRGPCEKKWKKKKNDEIIKYYKSKLFLYESDFELFFGY